MSLFGSARSKPTEEAMHIGAPLAADEACRGWEDLMARSKQGDFDSYVCLLQDMADWMEVQELPHALRDLRADLKRETLRAVHAERDTVSSAASVYVWFGAIYARKVIQFACPRNPEVRASRK